MPETRFLSLHTLLYLRHSFIIAGTTHSEPMRLLGDRNIDLSNTHELCTLKRSQSSEAFSRHEGRRIAIQVVAHQSTAQSKQPATLHSNPKDEIDQQLAILP